MMTQAHTRRYLKRVILITLALILILLVTSQAFARGVTAQIDHQDAEMGDIITLVVKTDFQTFDSPDFHSLDDQFEVLGSQRSSQIQIVNGNYQAYSRWDVRLTPKQAGDLVIPPFNVDGELSDPIVLHVSEAPKADPRELGSSFLESSVNITEPYVQQEVLFTLRFYHLGQFLNGNIRPPSFDHAITQNIRNQFNYQKRIGGKLYEVYEWTWAFYPQKSGAMTIPPQSFNGRIQYRGVLKLVQDKTQPIELNVQPQPDTYPVQSAWLPAKEVRLTEDWQTPNPIRVGDSITRTLTLQADGLLASQLPDFQFKEQAHFHIYPDQPHTNNQATENGMQSQKVEKLAIVPTEPGDIVLPELTLHWWNTEQNTLETITLPSKTLTVLPALTSQSNTFDTATLPETHETVSRETSTTDSTTWSVSWFSVLLLGLWLITLWYALKWRRALQNLPREPTETANLKNDQAWSKSPEMDTVCDETELDAKSLYRAVLAWQQQASIESSKRLLTDLQRLKAHLYHQEPLAPQTLADICAEIQHLQRQAQNAPAKTGSGQNLEPIYPNES
ncbi:BatD family protein [Hydrogenovibrio thermophilus]|uniref:Protein BatD n=1 Tax=Hydrogenovibrio thermophilus TaxID=265883 RepID=A0A451G488_9GAMM|nr:BatD family protein [Hydrogenovibrio thermophilus]QAB14277.1 protein BatD [Hydrogenovibrio thermophilus]